MMRVPERYRLPIALLVSAALVVLVFGVVTLASPPASSPTPAVQSPSPTAAQQSPSVPIATDPLGDPVSAVRAFFAAFAEARETDDPTLVLPFVTSTDSSAYMSVAGFLDGQKAVNKASITTVQRLENMAVEVSGASATAIFDYTEGGYDIDFETREPLESPVVLPTVQVTVELRQVEGRWLVDRYESRPADE